MATWIGVRLGMMMLAGLLLWAPIDRADAQPAQPAQPTEAKIGAREAAPAQWLDGVAAFFRKPIVNVALVTIGLIGLIFEFKYPGTTFPGSVAALCFVLF